MNDVDFPVNDVLDGIKAAQEVGFKNIKVNMVVKKGTNDHEIVAMAKHFKLRLAASFCASLNSWMLAVLTAGIWNRYFPLRK